MNKDIFLKGRMIFLFAFFSLSACAQHTAATSAVFINHRDISLSGMEQSILNYVNEHRKAIGKQALQMIDIASDEANEHSVDMAKGKTAFGHDGFENRVAVITKNIGRISAAAENVAYGELTAQQVVDGWLHSPGHKKNIEGDYTLTGIGVAKDKNGTIFYTQIFLRK
ncbi:MAG: CAP domain-containing protein [Ilyomonas sp.]